MSNRDYADLQELAIDYRSLAEENEHRAARLADALDAVMGYIGTCRASGKVPSVARAYELKEDALGGLHASK